MSSQPVYIRIVGSFTNCMNAQDIAGEVASALMKSGLWFRMYPETTVRVECLRDGDTATAICREEPEGGM